MMKKNLKYLLALLCIIVLLLCTGCSSDSAAPQPISITVWTYYNGTLLESFNTLVKTFNETVGKEKGIIVEAYSQGSVNELEASVMQSAEGKVGAAAMPNIFSAYADTAYALDKLGLVVDVSRYLTNISFSVGSGYMPVTKAANNIDTIKAAGLTLSPVVEQVLTGAVATINENRLYTPLAFEGCQAARKVLEYALSDKAAADRAIVVERIAAGMSVEEAEAEFLTDECFDSWYQETLTKLQAYE